MGDGSDIERGGAASDDANCCKCVYAWKRQLKIIDGTLNKTAAILYGGLWQRVEALMSMKTSQRSTTIGTLNKTTTNLYGGLRWRVKALVAMKTG